MFRKNEGDVRFDRGVMARGSTSVEKGKGDGG